MNRFFLLVGAGGFIGSVSRYLLSQFLQNKFLSTFPIGTLGVNIIGCLIIGLLLALSEVTNVAIEWRLFLVTGICGGFTTFSAFSSEIFSLMREGQFLYGFAYITASVVLGVFAVFIGYSIIKLL